MSSRQGGKLKPLKAPKKTRQEATDEAANTASAQEQKAKEKELKAFQERAKKGGLGTGLKKSGKNSK